MTDEATLARSAQRILAALQADGGTPLYALMHELDELRTATDNLIDRAHLSPNEAVAFKSSERDLAVADLLANPPVYVPGSLQEMDELTEADRLVALDVLSTLTMLDTTPPDVDLAAQQLMHFLGGSTAPFRPLPPRS